MSDSKEKYGAKDHPDVDELHKELVKLIVKLYRNSLRTVKLFKSTAL